ANIQSSHTHPGKAFRLKAIATGWNNAAGAVSSNKLESKTQQKIEVPATRQQPIKDQSILAEKFIAYDVSFFADPKGLYYVTIRNNLVKVLETELFIAGRLALSN